MIVEKVLNNNVVVSIDPNTRKEVILMGSGIAFNKKPGQLIDDKKIEKTFIVDDENLGNKIKKLINQIPEGIFEITPFSYLKTVCRLTPIYFAISSIE